MRHSRCIVTALKKPRSTCNKDCILPFGRQRKPALFEERALSIFSTSGAKRETSLPYTNERPRIEHEIYVGILLGYRMLQSVFELLKVLYTWPLKITVSVAEKSLQGLQPPSIVCSKILPSLKQVAWLPRNQHPTCKTWSSNTTNLALRGSTASWGCMHYKQPGYHGWDPLAPSI